MSKQVGLGRAKDRGVNPEQTNHLNKVADQFAELLDVAPENIGTLGYRLGDFMSIVLRVDLAERLLGMVKPHRTRTSLDFTHPDGIARGTWTCECGEHGSVESLGPVRGEFGRQMIAGDLLAAAQAHSDKYK